MKMGLFVAMIGRKAGGPETYEANLIRALLRIDRRNEYHVYFTQREARRQFDTHDAQLTSHVLWPPIRSLGIALGLPLQLLAQRVDLVHATFIPPLYSPKGYVLTMHDTSMFDHPEFYHPDHLRRLRRLIPLGIKRARLIVCVSQHTRDMVAERFGVPDERLCVVHHGVGDQFRPQGEDAITRVSRDKYGIRGPYLLFVGQLKTRSKNLLRLLEAFHAVARDYGDDLKLVLVGRRSWASEGIDATVHRLGLEQRVIELGHVADAELPALYSGARALVFPSLVEGFGFPVVEAMACGTPVVTSTAYCLPEIAGGAAVLVDPLSVDAIASGMLSVLRDNGLADSLRRRGTRRAGDFTWDAAGRKTLEAYERAHSL
jgi:glycosyltransferase involved in cell wall biosynthesis